MILTVTLNLALDVTYRVEGYERNTATRVESVTRRAGGKGVNVARVVHALGREVGVTGLAGGFAGELARADLAGLGIRDELVKIGGQSRQTLVVLDRDGSATGFWEPGPSVTAAEWRAFMHRFDALLESASAVVLSGSLPRGVPEDAYAQLIEVARGAGVPSLLDGEGQALRLGVAARPAVVKINATELSGATQEVDVQAGADELRREGAGAVVVTQGNQGLTYVGDEGTLSVAAPEIVTGNPTGAGDAASAALVLALVEGLPWTRRLAETVALSAAAVCAPVAGSFDADVHRRLRDAMGASSTLS